MIATFGLLYPIVCGYGLSTQFLLQIVPLRIKSNQFNRVFHARKSVFASQLTRA